MVCACSICGTIYNNFQPSVVTFHNIPKNEGRRQNWLRSIGKKITNFNPTHTSKICSQHFTDDSFFMSIGGRRFLKTDAVPTIFDVTRAVLEITPDFENTDNIYQDLDSEIDADTIDTISFETATTTVLEVVAPQRDVSDQMHDLDVACELISTSDIESQTEIKHSPTEKQLHKTKYGLKGKTYINDEEDLHSDLQRQLEEVNTHNAMLQRQLKNSLQKNRRYEKRVKNLTSLLRHFRDRSLR